MVYPALPATITVFVRRGRRRIGRVRVVRARGSLMGIGAPPVKYAAHSFLWQYFKNRDISFQGFYTLSKALTLLTNTLWFNKFVI